MPLQRFMGLCCALLISVGCGPTKKHKKEPPPPELVPLDGETTYEQAFQAACHNCYETKYFDNLVASLDHTRAIEIDIFDSDVGGPKTADWYVRHSPADVGNHNNCDNGFFSQCLDMLAAWHGEHPSHDVVTVFIDKKQDWGDGRNPADLDGLLAKKIGRENIFAVEDLLGDFAVAREAAREGNWPTMDSVKGKFVFVMTGGTILDRSSTQSRYIKDQGKAGLVFVAPDVDAKEDISDKPEGFEAEESDFIVFFNMPFDKSDLGEEIHSEGAIARAWSEEAPDLCLAAKNHINFVAHNEVADEKDCGGLAEGKFFEE